MRSPPVWILLAVSVDPDALDPCADLAVWMMLPTPFTYPTAFDPYVSVLMIPPLFANPDVSDPIEFTSARITPPDSALPKVRLAFPRD
jgi:hypothetical protein